MQLTLDPCSAEHAYMLPQMYDDEDMTLSSGISPTHLQAVAQWTALHEQ